MAENQIKTTSSKGLHGQPVLSSYKAVRKLEQVHVPKTKQSFQAMKNVANPNDGKVENWETVGLGKNKLKRKKNLSASLTSVGDSVNQEKRTRIEGFQLNCRGKLRARDTSNFEAPVLSEKAPAKKQETKKIERPVIIGGITTTNVLAAPPQRFKRKLQENLETIQKLNTLTEQLRLEVNELKSSLITERGAVRALRAQNDADNRKWKTDVKKLQHTLEAIKKTSPPIPHNKTNESGGDVTSYVAADGLINYEIQRLTNEIAVLKEANKTKDEKNQINGEADRRKAADMRTMKNAYEIRLTQIQKSAKIEITRLLEEIKTKERNIGQLKKDMQTLQNSKKHFYEYQPVKISTTKTNKTNETSQKPKKPTTTSITNPKNETDIHNKLPCQAQVTNEITQLKDIELINNTKNVHKSLEMRKTKAKSGLIPPALENISNRHDQIITNDESVNTWMTTTTTTKKSHSLSQDVVCALTQTDDVQEFRPKDNNSDTDSALSSAPPSISPQPPSTGSDSGVMWQTMHTYNKDLEKLQNEVEIYHKENERLKSELQLIKQELLTAEKAARANNNSAHIKELLERIKIMEEHELQLTSESNELREQNELLEFRILELEDDKMDNSTCESHCHRLQNLIQKAELDEKDKSCLQQLLFCVQRLDLHSDTAPMNDSSNVDQTLSEQLLRASVNQQASKPLLTTQNRIVATVQPYNNSAPTVTPHDSPRKLRHAWQSNSLSESGIFVECDFAGEHSDYDRSTISTQPECQERDYQQLSLNDSKRLQYYKDRLEQLEGKLLVYESSGDAQAKHLADRLQREIQLDKQLKELISRVESLLQENSLLEEEKCEFEEAENDTRLRLQRLEVELEILRQRNVELEFSKDALGAKYKDCRTECIILREDLCAFETQIRNLESDRQRAKQQLASLQRSLPLLVIFRLLAFAKCIDMGNELSSEEARKTAGFSPRQCQNPSECFSSTNPTTESRSFREINYLKDEVKSLRFQIKDINTRHYEAMETADTHWVDMEREYKEREEAYRVKEVSLKQKIAKLQDCLREDSRAAAEKIQQLEESEQSLKACLVRLTKEHRDLMNEHKSLTKQIDCNKEQSERNANQERPLAEALEQERCRNKMLMDDLAFCKKLQQNTEDQLKQETDALRNQIFDIKKEFLHIEVTNGELKEEVRTLEVKITEIQGSLKSSEERQRCLEDELRTKEELCQIMERKQGVCPEGYSLADELYDSPAKRAKREEVQDLQTASQGLGSALRDSERREKELPTHRDFQTIACSVKQLADAILTAQNPSEEMAQL